VIRTATRTKFAQQPMAAKVVYVFFRMAAPVTSGPIFGESVVPQQVHQLVGSLRVERIEVEG